MKKSDSKTVGSKSYYVEVIDIYPSAMRLNSTLDNDQHLENGV